MTPTELLTAAEAAAAGGRPLRLVTPTQRQPIQGFRAELLCVTDAGAVWLFSRAQARRLARSLARQVADAGEARDA